MSGSSVKTLPPIIALSMAVLAGPATAELWEDRQQAVSVFGGQMTWNDYGTIAYKPGDVEWADSHFAGVAYSRDWEGPIPQIRLGFEAQLVTHWGINDHVALNLPATIRYRALDPWIPVQGAAFGLGFSFASEPPQIEIERKGKSQEVLPYWFMEIEFGTPDWRAVPFVRIHHRSDGYIFADYDTGSNGVAAGVRVPF